MREERCRYIVTSMDRSDCTSHLLERVSILANQRVFAIVLNAWAVVACATLVSPAFARF
jgi:hypothetical protein